MGFTNGSRIKSIPANRSTGRGFAANRIYLDEFAYAEYADDIYQSVDPAVSQGGYITIGSTPNGIGNLFHQLLRRRRGVLTWSCRGIAARPTIPTATRCWTPTRARRVSAGHGIWPSDRSTRMGQVASEFECDFVRLGPGHLPA